MKAIATRYAPYLLLLTLAASTPVAVHTYAQVRTDDCAAPGAFIPRSLTGAAKVARDEWMRATYDAFAWREGSLRLESGKLIRWMIARTHDAKRIYHRPESVLVGGDSIGRTVEWIGSDDSRLPVHRISLAPVVGSRAESFVRYLLIYEGEPVANPYVAQLRAAPRLAFRGAVPMTLLIVYGEVRTEELAEAEQAAAGWLERAFADYRLACS